MVHGFSNARFKKCKTLAEALALIDDTFQGQQIACFKPKSITREQGDGGYLKVYLNLNFGKGEVILSV